MSTIQIVNVRNVGSEIRSCPAYRYIGRGSIFGNPFKIGVGVTRDEVITKYEKHLAHEMLGGSRLEEGIWELAGLYLEHGELILGCYCFPKKCHGEVIRKAVLRIAGEIEAANEAGSQIR